MYITLAQTRTPKPDKAPNRVLVKGIRKQKVSSLLCPHSVQKQEHNKTYFSVNFNSKTQPTGTAATGKQNNCTTKTTTPCMYDGTHGTAAAVAAGNQATQPTHSSRCVTVKYFTKAFFQLQPKRAIHGDCSGQPPAQPFQHSALSLACNLLVGGSRRHV